MRKTAMLALLLEAAFIARGDEHGLVMSLKRQVLDEQTGSHRYALDYLGNIGDTFPDARVRIRAKDWEFASMELGNVNIPENEDAPVAGTEVTISRLTPAVLIRTQAEGMNLAPNKGALKYAAYPATGDGSPMVARVSDKIIDIKLYETEKKWILVWSGDKSEIKLCKKPVLSHNSYALERDVECFDQPLLFLLDENIETATVSSSGIIFEFSEMALDFDGKAGDAATCIVAVPLGGEALLKPSLTESWSGKLPDEVLRQCRWWWEHSALFPLRASEEAHSSEDSDDITVSVKIEFLRLREEGQGMAPVCPMTALAMQAGMPVVFSEPPHETGIATRFGPFLAIPGVLEYSYAIQGLAKYAMERRMPADAADSGDFYSELIEEIDKVLDAGQFLAPPYLTGNFLYQIRLGNGRPLWSNPADTLYFLSQAMPLLDNGRKEKLLNYLREFDGRYPAGLVQMTPKWEGARRERAAPLQPEQSGKFPARDYYTIFNMFPIETLYGLAEYFTLSRDDAALKERRDAAAEIVKPYQALYDWPSAGFRDMYNGQPDPFGGCGGLKDYYGTGGVMDANRFFAGAIGFCRLAMLSQDDKALAQTGWHMLARAAVFRAGLGAYPYYRCKTGIDIIPEAPDWYARINDGYVATGNMGAPNPAQWLSADHDPRQVARMSDKGPVLANSSFAWDSQFPAFIGMTPELGRFLSDCAKRDSLRYLELIERDLGCWWQAYSPAVAGGETNYMLPCNQHSLFLACAWVRKDDWKKLGGYLDVPWFKVGDFYHIQKLAEIRYAQTGYSWSRSY